MSLSDQYFRKMHYSRPVFVLFLVYQNNNWYIFYNVKNYLSSILCWDSNSRPLWRVDREIEWQVHGSNQRREREKVRKIPRDRCHDPKNKKNNTSKCLGILGHWPQITMDGLLQMMLMMLQGTEESRIGWSTRESLREPP